VHNSDQRVFRLSENQQTGSRLYPPSIRGPSILGFSRVYYRQSYHIVTDGNRNADILIFVGSPKVLASIQIDSLWTDLFSTAVAAFITELFQDMRSDIQDASLSISSSGSTSGPLSVVHDQPYSWDIHPFISSVPAPLRPPRASHHYWVRSTASPESYRATGKMRAP
jgi:hypothetical protein